MKKNSKRSSLILSVVSIILCCTMLLGTTMAWFTDSVTSARNQIIAGNLDVELYNGTVEDANKVGNTTELFDAVDLWEPGVVVYEPLTVKNAGTLALKYSLTLDALNATEYEGKTLAEVIKVGTAPAGTDTTNRDVVVSAVTEWKDFSSFVRNGELKAEETDDLGYIVLYWEPTATDNDYNMNNGKTTELSIEVGVNLVATQLASESDSFGSDYDANADYDNTVTEEDIVNGGNIVLANDVVLEGTTTTITNNATINLNGKAVTADRTGNSAAESSALTVDNSATVTLSGNGSVTNAKDYAVTVRGGATVTISGGTYTADVSAVNVAEGTLYITGGEFKATGTTYGSTFLINCNDTNYKAGKANVIITGGTFYGWNPAASASENPVANFVAEGYEAVETATGVWTVVEKTVPAHTCVATTVWSSDETSHWHIVCTDVNCTNNNYNVKVDEANHDYADGECTVCDAEDPNYIAHTCVATTVWSSDETSHWHIACTDANCTNNNYNVKVDEANHDYADGECTVCDAEDPNYIAHTCVATTVWSSDETSHWHIACTDANCTNNNYNVKVDEADHDYTDGVCVCGDEETPVTHDCTHDNVEYTPNEDGTTHTSSCPDCDTYTPVTESHTVEEWTPSETNAGWEHTGTCTKCEASVTKYHNYDSGVAYDITCNTCGNIRDLEIKFEDLGIVDEGEVVANGEIITVKVTGTLTDTTAAGSYVIAPYLGSNSSTASITNGQYYSTKTTINATTGEFEKTHKFKIDYTNEDAVGADKLRIKNITGIETIESVEITITASGDNTNVDENGVITLNLEDMYFFNGISVAGGSLDTVTLNNDGTITADSIQNIGFLLPTSVDAGESITVYIKGSTTSTFNRVWLGSVSGNNGEAYLGDSISGEFEIVKVFKAELASNYITIKNGNGLAVTIEDIKIYYGDNTGYMPETGTVY